MLGDIQVKSVASSHFLGLTISRDLKWELNTTALLKKAQKFLRKLRKFGGPCRSSSTQPSLSSTLTYSIITWVIHSAERLIGCSLPSLKSLHDPGALRIAVGMASVPFSPQVES